MTGQRSVVVIGNFDGVHAGHRALLAQAQAVAPDLPLIVVTFWPHPMSVLHPDEAPQLLCDLPERIRLLRQAGAHDVRVVEFTPRTATWSPKHFVDFTILPLRPQVVVVGENFRFGHRAAGTVEVLREVAAGAFTVVSLPLLGDQATLSSSRVRAALAAGDVRQAAHMLGRPFRFSGIVVLGDQRGRTIGYPTANLTVPMDRACPSDGVYAGWLTRLDTDQRYPAAISVGSNPTFDGVERRVETHVLDRDDLELYGVPIGIDFIDRLRGQVRFDGVEALVGQMVHDVEQARDLLSRA